MKHLFIFFLAILSTTGFAQSAAGDLKFEQAETAYSQGNYTQAISALNEADKAYGSPKAKTLYLRIVAQDKLFEGVFHPAAIGTRTIEASGGLQITELVAGGGAEKAALKVNDVIKKLDGINISDFGTYQKAIRSKNMGDVVKVGVERSGTLKEVEVTLGMADDVSVDKLYDAERNYNLLESLNKNANAYLKAMESEGLDDKYREVYAISEKLKQYPKDKAAWLQEKQRREAEVQAEKKRIEQANTQRLAKVKAYDEKMDKYYRELAPKIDAWEYKDGITIGMDFNELKETKKDWFKGHKTEGNTSYFKKYERFARDQFQKVAYTEDKKVSEYQFLVVRSSTDIAAEQKKAVDKLKEYFGSNLVFDVFAYDNETRYFVLKSPYTKSKIILYIYDKLETIEITKTIVGPGVTEISANSMTAYALNLGYLERYTGLYANGQVSIKAIEGQNRLAMTIKDSPVTRYFYRKEKDGDVFVLGWVQQGNDYHSVEDNDANLKLFFDIQSGSFTTKENGEENTYKRYYPKQ